MTEAERPPPEPGPEAFDRALGRVFELYAIGGYDEALGIVLGLRGSPGREAQLAWFEACLRSIRGEGEAALGVLEDGLGRGLWWRPELMRDPDLDPLRGGPRFAAIVEECGRRTEWADAEGTLLLRIVEPPVPDGTALVALHGGSGNADEFAPRWAAAAAGGAVVVVPQSPLRPFSGGLSFWWPPPPLVAPQLAGHLAEVRAGHRVERLVLGGTSQGARTALWCALHDDPERALGVIAVAGAADLDDAAPLLPAAAERGLRVWFLSGDRDFALPAVRATQAAFEAAGIESRLTVTPGVGHTFPPDFPERLPELIAFVTGSV